MRESLPLRMPLPGAFPSPSITLPIKRVHTFLPLVGSFSSSCCQKQLLLSRHNNATKITANSAAVQPRRSLVYQRAFAFDKAATEATRLHQASAYIHWMKKSKRTHLKSQKVRTFTLFHQVYIRLYIFKAFVYGFIETHVTHLSNAQRRFQQLSRLKSFKSCFKYNLHP